MYAIESLDRYDRNPSVFFGLSIGLMAILFHQSNVIFGINISFSDFFCLVILLILLYNMQFVIPVIPTLFFMLVSTVVLITAIFYVPINFQYTPNPVRIISDYIKLIAIFIYFLLGYNLAKKNLLQETMKWYSFFGLFIGVIGIVFTLFHITSFSDLLFYEEIRYRGLMIDPNYYAVLQITALVFATRSKVLDNRWKGLAYAITFLAVVVSGSKTGLITLGCYIAVRVTEYFVQKDKKSVVIIALLFFIALAALGIPLSYDYLLQFISTLTASIPSIERVEFLVTDFGSAFSEGGSGREETWNVALQIIKMSPFIGIGIGTYTNIGFNYFQYDNVSHNTFLQLSAEWGIPLASLLFIYLFMMLSKITFQKDLRTEENIILRDIILILLMGSMAVSLNNARVFWFILGALFFVFDNGKESLSNRIRGLNK